MTVYIILNGEQGEGGFVQGVYADQNDAIAAALKIDCHFDGGWERAEPAEPDYYLWMNGCDWIAVRGYVVQ